MIVLIAGRFVKSAKSRPGVNKYVSIISPPSCLMERFPARAQTETVLLEVGRVVFSDCKVIDRWPY